MMTLLTSQLKGLVCKIGSIKMDLLFIRYKFPYLFISINHWTVQV